MAKRRNHIDSQLQPDFMGDEGLKMRHNGSKILRKKEVVV